MSRTTFLPVAAVAVILLGLSTAVLIEHQSSTLAAAKLQMSGETIGLRVYRKNNSVYASARGESPLSQSTTALLLEHVPGEIDDADISVRSNDDVEVVVAGHAFRFDVRSRSFTPSSE